MSEKQTPFYFSRKFALGCLAAAAIYFLVMEHWRHLLEVLPYLVFLLCPLMHLTMHGGHDQRHSEAETGCHHVGHAAEDADSAYRRGVEDGRKRGESR